MFLVLKQPSNSFLKGTGFKVKDIVIKYIIYVYNLHKYILIKMLMFCVNNSAYDCNISLSYALEYSERNIEQK